MGKKIISNISLKCRRKYICAIQNILLQTEKSFKNEKRERLKKEGRDGGVKLYNFQFRKKDLFQISGVFVQKKPKNLEIELLEKFIQ